MAIRIVRLGSLRSPNEGTRIGTVRRPPRGVPKAESPAEWQAFVRKYRTEMAQPESSRTLDLLAALSPHASFSLGCYGEDEAQCHRAVLRTLLAERGALMV